MGFREGKGRGGGVRMGVKHFGRGLGWGRGTLRSAPAISMQAMGPTEQRSLWTMGSGEAASATMISCHYWTHGSWKDCFVTIDLWRRTGTSRYYNVCNSQNTGYEMNTVFLCVLVPLGTWNKEKKGSCCVPAATQHMVSVVPRGHPVSWTIATAGEFPFV